ncbi:hypothetical protein K456DRAFT_56914 [Colletotrichum gloeosporioides 23]|nr:hypothetical protein K456DRAFT_56914 [Colletotrichum gloeosporioides 23]
MYIRSINPPPSPQTTPVTSLSAGPPPKHHRTSVPIPAPGPIRSTYFPAKPCPLRSLPDHSFPPMQYNRIITSPNPSPWIPHVQDRPKRFKPPKSTSIEECDRQTTFPRRRAKISHPQPLNPKPRKRSHADIPLQPFGLSTGCGRRLVQKGVRCKMHAEVIPNLLDLSLPSRLPPAGLHPEWCATPLAQRPSHSFV